MQRSIIGWFVSFLSESKQYDAMVNSIDYTASYNVIADLRYVCQLAEMLLFPKEEELTASGDDEYQVFCEIKRILQNNGIADGPENFGRLNDGNTSIENLYIHIPKKSLRKKFVQEVSQRMEGIGPTLERLASIHEEQIDRAFYQIVSKICLSRAFQLGMYGLSCDRGLQL